MAPVQTLAATALLLASACYALPSYTPWRQLAPADKHLYTFEHFKLEFGRMYATPQEEAYRRDVFAKNIAAIHTQNADTSSTWRAGVNKFADMTKEDMRRFKGKISVPDDVGTLHVTSANSKDLPASVDWRTNGKVTPVKNQEACGSCWAFSATETVESAVAMATGKLVELAPQELVDCVTNPDDCGGTGGCGGATQELGFAYAMLHGMAAETAYPYQAKDGVCRMTSGLRDVPAVVGIKGYVKLPPNDQDALLNAVATVGPVAISLDAAFGNYESGVYDGCSKANASTIDHGVQLVGYGSENGTDYWIVRNSWGSTWGDHGYIKLARSAGEPRCYIDPNTGEGDGCKDSPKTMKVCGECGVLSDSSYATGAYVVKDL